MAELEWRVAIYISHNKHAPTPKPRAEGRSESFRSFRKLLSEQNLTYNFTWDLYNVAGLGEMQLKILSYE